MGVEILIGDCREQLRNLPERSVHCCVTSPPYFGLRDYGHEGQMGLEPTPDEFVAGMVAVFAEVKRVLRDDGTLWLNLGDSYASSTKGTGGSGGSSGLMRDGRPESGRGSKTDAVARQQHAPVRVNCGVPDKNLIGIPWRVAFALQADGWYLRQDIIWHKPNPMPESVRDRCTKAHEYIFMLSKSPRYYYDIEAVAEPVADATISRVSQANLPNQAGSDRVPGKTNGNMKAVIKKQDGHGRRHAGFNDRYFSQEESKPTRNKRSVWTVTTKPFKGAHFATFPPDLIEPCILAGCPEGGTVLDPFGGAGTTGLVAKIHGRNAILCELNPEYAAMARERIDAPPKVERAKKPPAPPAANDNKPLDLFGEAA